MEPTTETPIDHPSGSPDAAESMHSRPNKTPAATVGSEQLTDPDPSPTCGRGATSQPPSYVWVAGRFEYPPRPRSIGVAMELQRVIGRTQTKGKTDQEVMRAVLRARENRHLVWEHCWFLMVQGLVAYQLRPRDPQGFEDLVEAALPPNSGPSDLVAVIGERGPISLDCGVAVPMLLADTIYRAKYEDFVASVPRPEKMTAKQFQPTVEQVFTQLTSNPGATDAERVQAFAAFTDTQMYHVVAEQFAADASLSSVEVHRSPMSDTQTVLKLTMTFMDRKTGVTRKLCANYDVGGKYPFKVTMWAPCYDL
jgi:hypothetical protein